MNIQGELRNILTAMKILGRKEGDLGFPNGKILLYLPGPLSTTSLHFLEYSGSLEDGGVAKGTRTK